MCPRYLFFTDVGMATISQHYRVTVFSYVLRPDFHRPHHKVFSSMLRNLIEHDTLHFARQNVGDAEVVESADTRCSGRRGR